MQSVEIPKYTVIQYVRNNKKIPHGVVVAIKTENGFRIGYSLCNKKDRFNKRMALKIALGRAGNITDELPTNNLLDLCLETPHPVRKMLGAFQNRCRKYYKLEVQ